MQPRGASQLDPGLGFGGVDPSPETRSQDNLVAVLLASEIVNNFSSLLSHLNQQNIIKNQQNNVAGRPRIGDDTYMTRTQTTETTMIKLEARPGLTAGTIDFFVRSASPVQSIPTDIAADLETAGWARVDRCTYRSPTCSTPEQAKTVRSVLTPYMDRVAK